MVAAVQTSLPPGPGVTPWNVWSFVYHPRRYYARLRRYGAVVTIFSADGPSALALTPDGARQVLTADPDVYAAFHSRGFRGLTGPGSLWVLDGSRHRRERQLLAPAFHSQRIRTYGQLIREVTRRHTAAWHPGLALRAYDAMLDISRDIILRVVFGIERDADVAEARRLMAEALDATWPTIVFVPALQAGWYPPWRRFHRAKREFSSFVMRYLAERRASGSESHDVLDLLLSARFDDGTSLSDDEIFDELTTIGFSGHETSAVALSWALYELGRHPAVLARLREELDALGPDPEPDLVARQSYLGAVCNETLRLHTILTEVGRMTRAPLELLGYTIPPGVGVGVGICAIHQDPELYPEPDRFRPERFLERTFGPYEFLPFGGGHRRCLGAVLADYEMRLALAEIVTSWEIEIDGDDHDARHNIGMGPAHGVRMRIRGRRRAG